MKKGIFLITILLELFNLNAQTFSFKTCGDTSVYLYDEEGTTTSDNREIMKSGKIIKSEYQRLIIDLLYNKNDKEEIAYINDINMYGRISIANLKPENATDLLPDCFISVTDPGIKKRFIPSYMVDILKTGKTEQLKKIDLCYAKEYREIPNDYIAYSMEKKFYYAVISNIGIKLHSDDNFIFTDIKKLSPTKYECTGVGFSMWNPYLENSNYWQTYFENTSELGIERETIELTLDGDYLTIFNKTRNKEIITLVCINDSVEAELISLFNDNERNLSKVTWPRHADGSCDYDNSSTIKTVAAQPSTNVSVNELMSVTENLKLRSGEATSTQVLAVMSAGTKVKILQLGKAETIDGINSNWVKVEVQRGSKDRDGKEIKEGTVGWCYGGYLK